MEQITKENVLIDAITEAIKKADEVGGLQYPEGMIAFRKAIDEYISREIWGSARFQVCPSPKCDVDWAIRNEAYGFMLNKIKRFRESQGNYTAAENDIAVAYYGYFVVNKDGSIDQGAYAYYHHAKDWHKDPHHLSHMLPKAWVQNYAADYLKALAHSAKIQGIKSFTINVERISTK